MFTKKSGAEKRVIKISGLIKQPVLWIAAAVVTVTACIVLLTDGIEDHNPAKNLAHVESEEDSELEHAFAKISEAAKEDKIGPGLNSSIGWIPDENVYFSVTGEMEQNIYNPEPDFDAFIRRLRYEIINNPSFVLKAEDTGDAAQLDLQQKERLADAITEITGYMTHENVHSQREAAYPFYRLDFKTYSMVITTNNQLLTLLDGDTAYDYGIGREGMPIRFVTPNIDFINEIKVLLPAKPNTAKDNFNYLMNAEKLIFSGDYSNKEEFSGQVQINKCVRAIKEAAGSEISKDDIDNSCQEKNIYTFYINGGRFDVTHTDKYIEYGGKYYESLVRPGHLVGSLFAAYF